MADSARSTQNTSLESLQQELASKRADLLAAQRGHKTGELTNPRALGALRRDIARLLTQINALQQEGTN